MGALVKKRSPAERGITQLQPSLNRGLGTWRAIAILKLAHSLIFSLLELNGDCDYMLPEVMNDAKKVYLGIRILRIAVLTRMSHCRTAAIAQQ